jgi:hypothetical protein
MVFTWCEDVNGNNGVSKESSESHSQMSPLLFVHQSLHYYSALL